MFGYRWIFKHSNQWIQSFIFNFRDKISVLESICIYWTMIFPTKAVRWVQLAADYFAKMESGQLILTTIKSMMSLGAGKLYLLTNQNSANLGMEWSVTVDKFPIRNCLISKRCSTLALGRKGSTSFANTNTMCSWLFTSQSHSRCMCP